MQFRIIFFISIIFIPFISNSQDSSDKKYYLIDNINLSTLSVNDRNILDSCLTMYHRSLDDTSKINYLEMIIEKMENKYWEDYQKITYQLIREEIKNNLNPQFESFYYKKLVSSINNMGLIYLGSKELDKGEKLLKEGLLLADKYSTISERASLLNNLGGIYLKKEDPKKAIKAFEESLEIRTKLGNQVLIANSVNNIGNILLYYGKQQEALEFFQRGLLIQKQQQDQNGIVFSQYNIASVYKDLGLYEEAITALNENIKLLTEIHDNEHLADNLELKGVVYFKMNAYLKAITNLKEASQTWEELKRPKKVVKNNLIIAKSYSEIGLFDKAIKLYDDIILVCIDSAYTLKKNEALSLKIASLINAQKYSESMYQLNKWSKEDNIDSLAQALILEGKAKVNLAEGNLSECEKNLDMALNLINSESISSEILSSIYLSKAHLAYLKNDIKAISFIEKSIDLSEGTFSNESTLLLAEIYSKFGKNDLALKNYQLYVKRVGNMSKNVNIAYQIAELENVFEENQTMQDEEKEPSVFNWLTYVLIIPLIILLIVFLKNRKTINN